MACVGREWEDDGNAGRLSSVVEQRFCKPLVVGSNPTAGSGIVRDEGVKGLRG